MCDYGAQLVPEDVAGYEKYKKKLVTGNVWIATLMYGMKSPCTANFNTVNLNA